MRIIYYYLSADWQVWLMTIYDKSEMADLTAEEKQLLRKSVETETRARKAEKRAKSRGK